MTTSIIGKRTRSSQGREEHQSLPIKRVRRSFRDENDENRAPTEETETANYFGIENIDEEDAVFSPLATRTPSTRRTKIFSEVDPVKYRKCLQTTSTPLLPMISPTNIHDAAITPSTPRHRDVYSRTPVTPRHRVMSVGKVSRRSTPQTPLTPTSSQTVYHQARQLFSRSADPGQLVGRDTERAKIREFLDRCQKSRPNGCLYVSGPPGTGKSAMINEITTQVVTESSSIRKAYINCMSIKSSKDLYTNLLDLLCDDSDLSEDDSVDALQKIFVPKKKSEDVFLVVLDEIDHILSLDLESLYRVFEWSMQNSSRLVLVGIANALDLTDRFLPRLKSRNLKPELLPFLPYTAVQIKAIITKRLKSLLPAGTATPDHTPFFHPAAIELCSRKVSSQTGDLRKAFEVCRRAIDHIESETRHKLETEAKEQVLQMTPSRKVLGENINQSSPSRTSGKSLSAVLARSLSSLTVETAPRVSISHLNKVTAAAFSNGANQRLKTLNLQQKAALCALMALEKRNRAALDKTSGLATPSKSPKTAAPTVKTLFDTYSLLCKQDAVLHPLSSSEFREVVGSLETLSLVTAVDGKTGSFAVLQPHTPSRKGRKNPFGSGGAANGDERRVASCVGDREIEHALDGVGADILKSILSGEALD